jgi:hypothetical protein
VTPLTEQVHEPVCRLGVVGGTFASACSNLGFGRDPCSPAPRGPRAVRAMPAASATRVPGGTDVVVSALRRVARPLSAG